MKQLILMSACPGSGKSTWCNNFIKKNQDKKIVILSSDEIRKELTGQYEDFSKQKEVWETFEARIKKYNESNEDLVLILDALNDLNVLRQKYANMCSNFDKKTLVFIKKPLKDVIRNNLDRRKDKQLPEDALLALYNKLEAPDEETLKLYDEYIFIDYHFAKEE